MEKLTDCIYKYFTNEGNTEESRLKFGNLSREMILRSSYKSYKKGRSPRENRQFWFLIIFKTVLIVLALSSIILKILEGFDVFKLDEKSRDIMDRTQYSLEWMFILLLSLFLLYIFWPENINNKIMNKPDSWWRRSPTGVVNQTNRLTVFLCSILIVILIVTNILEKVI